MHIANLFISDHITTDNCYYLLSLRKNRSKKKKCWHTNNIKKEKDNEFKKVGIKSRTCYYFDDIIKIEDLVFDSILLDKKSNENILIYDDLYKTLIGAKLLRIIFDKVDGFIRDYVEQNI